MDFILQKASLEGTLRDTEMRYNMEIENLNGIIVQLEAELMQLRNNIQQQTQEYEALLNIKMKLEAEIATYRRLLDGEDFKLVLFKNVSKWLIRFFELWANKDYYFQAWRCCWWAEKGESNDRHTDAGGWKSSLLNHRDQGKKALINHAAFPAQRNLFKV